MKNKIKTWIYAIFGLVAFLNQVLGVYVILILLGLLTQTWIILSCIGILYTILDIVRHKDFIKQGKEIKLGGYHDKVVK